MNFFWAGGPMSFLRYMTLKSFRYYNPDWTMRLWSAPVVKAKSWRGWESSDSQDYHGADYMDRVKALRVEHKSIVLPLPNLPPAHACDLCEWHVLSTEGGWFSDMDILYVRPMPVVDGDVFLCYTPTGFGVGFLGGSPRNPAWAAVYQAARKGYRPDRYQSTGVNAVAGRFGDPAQGMARHYPLLRVVTLPAATVYPFSYLQVTGMWTDATALSEETIGVHWFGAHPESQQRNGLISPTNYQPFGVIGKALQALAPF
jgi:hypothetical protein